MTQSRFAIVAFAAALLAGCSSGDSNAPSLEWQKVPGTGPGGAVLGFGNAGTFDERGNFTISAFRDGDILRLYYGGADSFGNCPGPNGSHWRIGLATSSDGVNWTRVPGDKMGGSILDLGDPGHFDDFLTYRPYVLKDGSTYRLWYNGTTGAFNCPSGTLAENRRVGYAESTDGKSFTRMNDGPGPDGTVLPLGPPGSIDERQIGYVWVIKDDTEYKMYYSANDKNLFWRVALAVSPDARHWTKVPGNQTGGAVLDLGPAGSFDVACAYEPSVVKEREGLYRMWYRGCQAPGAFGGPGLGVFGYAESSDGVNWVKIPQSGAQGAALTQGPAGSFDSVGLTTPSVFLDGNTWTMYYAAFDTNGIFLTGLARAPNP
jgi:hypothetical protein